MTADLVIVEARLNEYTTRDSGSKIPYTVDEIVADAASCRAAGAAAVHFHGRTDDGSPDLTIETTLSIVAGIRAATDLLIHPTLGVEVQDPDPRVRLAAIERLVEEGLKPDFVPLDMGSMNRTQLTPDGDGFVGDDTVYVNTVGTLRGFAVRLRELGVKPYLQIWNVPGLRLAHAFSTQGLLEGPVWMTLGLTAEPMLSSHPASLAGLRSYLGLLPPIDLQWAVTTFGGDVLSMAEDIIGSGGHVSLGLGDYDYPQMGSPSNAELIGAVAEIARSVGRQPATPAQARALLAIR